MTQSKDINGISRRRFMTLAGGAAGLAAMASMGIPTGWAANDSEVDTEKIKYQEEEMDILVVGGGIAALFAAVKGHDAGAKVMMVSKGRLGSSGQTPHATAIHAYIPENEKYSLDEMVDAVSLSALGTNNPVYTRLMMEHSRDRASDLRKWGFFESALYAKSFSKPIQERNIPLMERVMIASLIKENGRVVGAVGFSMDEEKLYLFKAKAVILCTGAGGFKPNGFPLGDLTHDGSIMAYDIGAKVTGKEWNDVHGGGGDTPASPFKPSGMSFGGNPALASFELQHDLGVDNCYRIYKTGNFMGGGSGQTEVSGGPYRPDLPTDMMRKGRGGNTSSAEDASGGGSSEEEGRGGGSTEGGGRGGGSSEGGGRGGGSSEGGGRGGGSSEEGARGGGAAGEVASDSSSQTGGGPARSRNMAFSIGGCSAGLSTHKSEGLAPMSDKCESNIPGLYAAGDALGSSTVGGIYAQGCAGMTGSAAEGGVAAEAAAEYCRGVDMPVISSRKIAAVKEKVLAPLKRESGYGAAWVTQTLQGIMIPNFVLYIKKESMLKAALAYVEELRDSHMPKLRAADMHELRLAHETANMIICAEMKLRASLFRTESRVSHYRLDYPDLDDENWRAWVNIYKGEDGTMQLEKQPWDQWPPAS